MSVFSTNSKLYKFMQKLTDIFTLNVMWLIFSLPIVTVGASTIAASAVALKMSEEREGKIASQFIKQWKANLRQGIPMSLISIISIWAVYIDIQFIINAVSHRILFIIVGVGTAYILGFSELYAYPLLARYENSLMGSLRNSFEISMKYFLRSVLLVIVLAVEICLILWNETTVFIGILVGPAFIIYTVCAMALPLFRKIEKLPETKVDRSAEEKDDIEQ